MRRGPLGETAGITLWQPSAERIADANITAFRRHLETTCDVTLEDYAALHRFSIDRMEAFWRAVWDFTGVVAEYRGESVLADGDTMAAARFFPDARLNFAERE